MGLLFLCESWARDHTALREWYGFPDRRVQNVDLLVGFRPQRRSTGLILRRTGEEKQFAEFGSVQFPKCEPPASIIFLLADASME